MSAGYFTRVYGSGPRPALMVHCSLAHSGAWGGLAALLGDRLTMTAFDMPGHGRSPELAAGVDFNDETTRVATALAESLTAAGPIDLIGHSFGAVAALRTAMERPELVRRLVLIEPSLIAAIEPGLAETYLAEMVPFAEAMATDDHELAARLFLGPLGGGQPWDEMPEAQRDYIVARMPLVRAGEPALYRDRAGLLSPGRLEAMALPVLLITGGRSPRFSGAISDRLAARIPGARHVVVPEGMHMVPVTHPALVAAVMRDFLA